MFRKIATYSLLALALVAGCRASDDAPDWAPPTPFANPSGTETPAPTSTPGETPAPSPTPDPRVTLTISEPNVLLPLAAETSVHLVLHRETALTGLPSEITVEGLPAGVTADPLTIPPGDRRTHADLVLRATPGTSIDAPHPMRFVATLAGVTPSRADLQLVRRGYPGTLDVEFAEGGIHDIGLPFAGRMDQVRRDGAKFVFSVVSWDGVSHLVRVGAEGVLDTTFDGDGVRDLPSECGGEDVEVLPNGRIVTIGWALVSGWSDIDVVVCKFLPDGAPDGSFGTAGRVQVDFGAVQAVPRALVLDGSTIWVGGGLNQNAFLLKLQSNGGLDTTWGEGGRSVIVPPEALSYGLNDLVVLGDGSMVAVGSDHYNYGGFAYRFTSAGTLDPAFGEAGRAPICGCLPSSITRDPAGRFVATGGRGCEGGGYFVSRFLPDGSPDPTFGTNGCVSDGREESYSRAVAFQGDDLLVAGALFFPEHSSTTDFALVRYDETGTPDAGFGADGIARKYIGSMEVCGNFDDYLVSVTPRADGTATVLGNIGGRTVMMRIWL